MKICQKFMPKNGPFFESIFEKINEKKFFLFSDGSDILGFCTPKGSLKDPRH